MQASRDESGLGSPAPAPAGAQGLPARAGEVGRVFVHKAGWAQPVGHGRIEGELEKFETEDFTALRLELRDFYLSHAAALFLLQGASLRNLFDNVVIGVGERAPDVYSLAVATPARLFVPPPRATKVVLAHILERPVNITPDEIFTRLFREETRRSSF